MAEFNIPEEMQTYLRRSCEYLAISRCYIYSSQIGWQIIRSWRRRF